MKAKTIILLYRLLLVTMIPFCLYAISLKYSPDRFLETILQTFFVLIDMGAIFLAPCLEDIINDKKRNQSF
jgi:hypothetical protein